MANSRRSRKATPKPEQDAVQPGNDSPLKAWLQSLYDEHGYLTPELVRDDARNPESPGHAAVFNVGAAEAAEAYYLQRAHQLIQRVRIIIKPQPARPPMQVRAYHAVPGGEESAYVYRSVDDLIRQPDQLQLARNEAMRRVRDAERSVEALDMLTIGTPSGPNTKRALDNLKNAREALTAA